MVGIVSDEQVISLPKASAAIKTKANTSFLNPNLLGLIKTLFSIP